MLSLAQTTCRALCKFSICGVLSVLCTLPSHAVTAEWVSGTPELGYAVGSGFYGLTRSAGLGIPDPLNNPGLPETHPVWIDHEGNVWMYQMPEDMWRYTPATNIWTRMSIGGPHASLAYDPLTRATWTAADGSLWLIDYLNIWRYDTATSQWTQVGSFSGTLNTGTLGVPDAANSPGGREEPNTWTDVNNDIYLYGGRYTATTGPNANRFGHDMWKYDTSERIWVWLSGNFEYTGAPYDAVVYGTKGVFHSDNHPRGTRSGLNSWPAWVDSSGNLWMMDEDVLWQYDITLNQWAWFTGTPAFGGEPVYGTKGVADPANSPGPQRSPMSWTDADGDFWLYSTDLWKFDVSAKAWAWMGGSQGQNSANTYIAMGVADPANWPASRGGGTTWIDRSGKFYMFGGYSAYNDTWSYDSATGLWTYWKGASGNTAPVVFGTEDVPAPENSPGSKKNVPSWSDSDGNFWIFSGSLSDLGPIWKFDSTLKQWIFKGNLGQLPDFGALGIESSTSHPGARNSASTWTDHQGYAWMFGGYGQAADRVGRLADLWRFNPVTEYWTWMGGSKNSDVDVVTDSTTGGNHPGSRSNSAVWTDASGNLWLFGGTRSFKIPGYEGWITPFLKIYYYNDLWRFDTGANQWQLVQPDTSVLQSTGTPGFTHTYYGSLGVYGVKGQPAPTNRPGSRLHSVTWTDQLGNLWMFGGEGYRGETAALDDLNDLWKFNPYTGLWTWVNGSDEHDQPDTFVAARDQFDPQNQPGSRMGAAGWQVGHKLLLHGGTPGPTPVNQTPPTFINALWTYNISSNTWSWTSNYEDPIYFGSYGTKGVPSENNFPGLRSDAMAWKDNNNRLWLYGGDGYAQWGKGRLDDVWRINSLPAAAHGWELYE